MMKGKLYGIGTGPGDPELLTIKAVNTIQKCDVIAVPITGDGERAAFSIIEKYLAGKELLECRFSMEKDIEKRREARQRAAAGIMSFLDNGKDVGFITLGDPVTYSTYMYVHEIIVGQGIDAEIIPGITSCAAAAAAFGIALCEGSETLTIIPASRNNDIDELLDRSGNKVIMKSGGSLVQVLEKLKERSCGERTRIACRCTMDGQRLFNSIDDYEASYEKSYEKSTEPKSDYFTIAIVKEK
jgi:precorrin-2/cobalt-factor-2 C20-methyltransferase